MTVKQLAQELPEQNWREVAWREGSRETLRSRFAALRVRPAYGDGPKGGLQPEQWLLMEWPAGAEEPSGYWLARLPVRLSLKRLVWISKHRWVIERDYEELKQELGLGHYEGRNWRGFHHHGTLCIAAYGFLVAERSRFSPQPTSAILGYAAPQYLPTSGRAEGRARAQRHNPQSIATIRIKIARFLVQQLPCCPLCCRLRV
jgi:SRSO17 transposase